MQRWLSLFLTVCLVWGCSSTGSERSKKPEFQPMGSVCKKRFEPLMKKLEGHLSKAEYAAIQPILRSLLRACEVAQKSHRPKVERENLQIFFQLLKRMHRQLAKALEHWEAKDRSEKLQKVVRKLKQSCLLCHKVYRL